jgi:hypothetical protein
MFNIFHFDSFVMRENTLSTISSYIFMNSGLFTLINHKYFDNFIENIMKGYGRKNPYHNDLHAADVEQTIYIFNKYGFLEEVYFNLFE